MSRGALPGALFDTGGGALPGVPAETLANKGREHCRERGGAVAPRLGSTAPHYVGGGARAPRNQHQRKATR